MLRNTIKERVRVQGLSAANLDESLAVVSISLIRLLLELPKHH